MISFNNKLSPYLVTITEQLEVMSIGPEVESGGQEEASGQIYEESNVMGALKDDEGEVRILCKDVEEGFTFISLSDTTSKLNTSITSGAQFQSADDTNPQFFVSQRDNASASNVQDQISKESSSPGSIPIQLDTESAPSEETDVTSLLTKVDALYLKLFGTFPPERFASPRLRERMELLKDLPSRYIIGITCLLVEGRPLVIVARDVQKLWGLPDQPTNAWCAFQAMHIALLAYQIRPQSDQDFRHLACQLREMREKLNDWATVEVVSDKQGPLYLTWEIFLHVGEDVAIKCNRNQLCCGILHRCFFDEQSSRVKLWMNGAAFWIDLSSGVSITRLTKRLESSQLYPFCLEF